MYKEEGRGIMSIYHAVWSNQSF